jgi:electron transfer flavoprotein alpha subunit
VILGLVEHERGQVDPQSLEMLGFARGLAERLNAPLHAALIGTEARSLAEHLSGHGVSTLHLVEHPLLGEYAPEAAAESAVQLMARLRPQVVTAAASDRGNEVMAHVAARTNLPMAANCTEVEPGDPFRVTRIRWGGSLLEQARLEGSLKLLTVLAGAEGETPAGAGEPAIDTFEPVLSEREFRVRVSARVERETGEVSLTRAPVVVGGGRGLGSAEAFASLEELALLLGGAVGCSRAVTSLGWRPHSDQIGQTGTRIAPDLYIACGISGAIQHMVGCNGARRILAINTDPLAPILAHSDYAVIGDVNEVVPALTAELAKARAGTS